MKTSVTTKALLLSLLLLVTGSAWADWVALGAVDDETFYIDPATIRKDGNLRKVWEIVDHKQRQRNGEFSIRSRKEYDCSGERVRTLTLSTHSGPMATGETIASGDPRARTTARVNPASHWFSVTELLV